MRLIFISSCFLNFFINFGRGESPVQEDPDLLDNGDGSERNPNPSHKALYPSQVPDDFVSAPRIKRTLELEPIGFEDFDYVPENPRLIRRPSLDGPCHVSNGFKQNQDCYQGQVCVDKDTNMQVDCPLPSGSPCSPCMPGGPPPSNCPRGCSPGQGCPPLPSGSEDGICVDPTRPSEDYVDAESTTLKPPKILKRGALPFGATCSSYGDIINLGLVDNKEICNWAAARLECIPNKRRTTPSPSSTVTPGEPDRPRGTCKCMLGLGKKAVALEDDKLGSAVCYIPANKGIHSECDRDIYLPHGLFEGVKPNGKSYIKGHDAAAKFCVPNSECRTGEKYTGLRCMCKKGAKWEEELGTCAGGNRIGSGEEGSIKILVVIGTFWILKIN